MNPSPPGTARLQPGPIGRKTNENIQPNPTLDEPGNATLQRCSTYAGTSRAKNAAARVDRARLEPGDPRGTTPGGAT